MGAARQRYDQKWNVGVPPNCQFKASLFFSICSSLDIQDLVSLLVIVYGLSNLSHNIQSQEQMTKYKHSLKLFLSHKFIKHIYF